MSTIEKNVMASVAVIYAAHLLMSATALKLYVLLFSIGAIAKLVWVAKVFQNFFAVEKNGFGAISNYLLFAVEHTNLAVQVTLVVAIIAFAGLMLDAIRSFTPNRAVFA